MCIIPLGFLINHTVFRVIIVPQLGAVTMLRHLRVVQM